MENPTGMKTHNVVNADIKDPKRVRTVGYWGYNEYIWYSNLLVMD